MPAGGRKTVGIGKNKLNSRNSRIVVPQPEKRPLHIPQRNLIKRDELTIQDDWWILHRRGPRRTAPDHNPNEDRAIPTWIVRGSLPERIVYQRLLDMKYVAGIDFDFQSSMEGGRLELGGIVADFLLPQQKICIQVQGPSHDAVIRIKKDEEQRLILESYGYNTIYLDQDTILDVYAFEDAWRSIFNLNPIWGGGQANSYTMADAIDGYDGRWILIAELITKLKANLIEANDKLVGVHYNY